MIWSNRFFFTPWHSHMNLLIHMIWSNRFFFTPWHSHMNLLIHTIWSNRFFFTSWPSHMNLLRLSPLNNLHPSNVPVNSWYLVRSNPRILYILTISTGVSPFLKILCLNHHSYHSQTLILHHIIHKYSFNLIQIHPIHTQ